MSEREDYTFTDHLIDKSLYGVYKDKGFWKACLFYKWPQHVSIVEELPLSKSKTSDKMIAKLNKYFKQENIPSDVEIYKLS